jgi:hypothetical protein
MLREEDVIQTAKEIRRDVRRLAGLELDWEKAGAEMRAWYIMLARRAEGLEGSKLQ